MDEEEEKVGEDGFKVGGSDEDEPLDIPDVDFGLDEEDPDKDS